MKTYKGFTPNMRTKEDGERGFTYKPDKKI